MVVIPPNAPLELMALPLMFFQKQHESAIASASGIFVSWSSSMSGLSDLIISFIAYTLLKPPRPLQFQEMVFNISLLIEILLKIYCLFLPLLDFSGVASLPQYFSASLAPSLFLYLALLGIFVTSFLLWLAAKLLHVFPEILVKVTALGSILAA